MNYARFLFHLMYINLKSSLALRTSFLMQMVLMMMNNLIFFTVWWILFKKVNDIQGWTFQSVQVLYGLAAGTWGLSIIVGYGIHDIAKKVINGDLDAYLVQPKNPLLHISASKTSPAGWGDLVTAAILFHWAGVMNWQHLPQIVAAMLIGATVMVAVKIIANSMVFWLGNMDGFHAQLYEWLIMFSTYPEGLFQGWFKVILFSVVPAGFVSHLPSELILNFSWSTLGLCSLAALFYLFLSIWIFHRGLDRYESGNLLTRSV